MKKLLIIGADSFIARAFIETYHTEFDILGYSRKKIEYCKYLLSIDFSDISDEHFQWADIVMNFAAIVHQPKETNKVLYEKVNTLLPLNLAKRAKERGVAQFIQMSTISVYGTESYINVNTSVNPDTLYGKSKLEADYKLLNYKDNTFEVSICRPPMVYGKYKAPGNMKNLIKLIKIGIPLPFKGINNKRDFINIQNLVQYLSITIEKKIGGIILISDQEAVSTEYLCRIIIKYLNKKLILVKMPKMALNLIKVIWSEKYNKLFGSLRIKTNFQFENLINRTSVEEGIKRMIIDDKYNII